MLTDRLQDSVPDAIPEDGIPDVPLGASAFSSPSLEDDSLSAPLLGNFLSAGRGYSSPEGVNGGRRSPEGSGGPGEATPLVV